MRRVSSVWVPHFLTNVQMSDRITVCQENLGLIKEVPNFLGLVITCDESWVHYFYPKSKQESSHWKSSSSPQKKEGAPVKIGWEGAQGFFRQLRTHLSACNSQESENRCGVLL